MAQLTCATRVERTDLENVGRTNVESVNIHRPSRVPDEMGAMDVPVFQGDEDVMRGTRSSSDGSCTVNEEALKYNKEADDDNMHAQDNGVLYHDKARIDMIMESNVVLAKFDCTLSNKNDGNDENNESVVKERSVPDFEEPKDNDEKLKHESEAQLRDLFWWVRDIDDSSALEPFTCVLCRGKLQAQQQQLETHESGKVHRHKLLACIEYLKLECFVALEKADLPKDLEIKQDCVFFLRKN